METKLSERWIKVTQKVTYYQKFELTDEQLEVLENADELDISQIASDGGRAYELIEGLIDYSEVFDTEQEFTDFELTTES